MYRAMMKRCCMALTFLALFCKCSEGFVVVSRSHPRARLAGGRGSSGWDMIRAAQVGASPPLSSPSRRRRGRAGNQQNHYGGGGGGGVGSLRAGMDMPSLELVAGFLDGPAANILEQSARHHYPSAFIGGTVGVLGTLTAIQVCCVRMWGGVVCVCVGVYQVRWWGVCLRLCMAC